MFRMKKMFIIPFLLLAWLPIYSQVNGSFIFDGLQRSYITYLPQSYSPDESYPLLLALHGYTQTGQGMMQFSGLNQIADTAGFIVVYPNGVGNAWNVGFAGGSTADDVGFLNALIDTLNVFYNIDLKRTYAAGFSNGGFMSYRLACESANRMAAIASVAGTMTENAFTTCTPQRAVPVLHIHGTNDIVIAYNGGFGNKSVDQVLSLWTDFNICPETPVVEDLPDLVAEGSTVQRFTWGPCGNSTEVALLKVINGGHTWPGSVGTTGIGNTNRDISASGEIWKFVSRFSLDENTGVSEVGTTDLMIYPNPLADGMLHIIWPAHHEQASVFIYSSNGSVVYHEKMSPDKGDLHIETASFSPGLYIARVAGGKFNRVSKFVVR